MILNIPQRSIRKKTWKCQLNLAQGGLIRMRSKDSIRGVMGWSPLERVGEADGSPGPMRPGQTCLLRNLALER